MANWLPLIFHHCDHKEVAQITGWNRLFFLVSCKRLFRHTSVSPLSVVPSLCFHGSSFHLVSLSHSHRRVGAKLFLFRDRPPLPRRRIAKVRNAAPQKEEERNESAWNEYGVRRNETREKTEQKERENDRNNTCCE